MRSLGLDPSSRLGFKLQRIWLTPLFRALLRTGIPSIAVCAAIYAYINQPEVKQSIAVAVLDVKSSIHDRPEFMVHLMAVEGTSPEVAEIIREATHLDLPMSSFDLDLEKLRTDIVALPGVRDATLRIRAGGVLETTVIERVPAFVWRKETGLTLVDIDGVTVGSLAARAGRADLPLIVGKGADQAVEEALALVQAYGPIASRVRGLRRVGERRWDVVLDREQVIQLPENGAIAA
ncbi:MAG: cell division protein FtsQ/DivIB, partial [Pseudomonadota bacterium]